jgi:hypothetical protein
MHPYPETRFDARHPRQEPSAVVPHAGICAGAAREGGPYRIEDRDMLLDGASGILARRPHLREV